MRQGFALEMNPYCRRAVSKGVELAEASGGSSTVITLGPPSAEDVLREAVAWGATAGLHLCDDAFAGSDSLASARALVAALVAGGPFDLILLGRNSVDGETGQVGPEVAQLLDLPFAGGVRTLQWCDTHLTLDLETDDGLAVVDVELPAVLTVAERLCEPCKVDPEGRAAVPPERIVHLTAAELGPGPWGEAGSPTRVGDIHAITHQRDRRVLAGSLECQVAEAVDILVQREALGPRSTRHARPANDAAPSPKLPLPDPARGAGPIVAVLVEHDRLQIARELIGAASHLAGRIGGTVHALSPVGFEMGALAQAGADTVVVFTGSRVGEDVADALVAWMGERNPWAILAPSTSFGREVAGRAAAATGSGLVGDAIGLRVVAGALVAAKPAFAGALVADITCHSPAQLVTVRPGVLPIPFPRPSEARTEIRLITRRGRVHMHSEQRTDDIETLARAECVIGVGMGVDPDDYERLSRLSALLGAELAATRKVTDNGWAPRARQIGLTGRAIAPRLYVAIGLSGKFNHMVGVRSAGTILAINEDPAALVFEHCDVGVLGDWRDVLPVLEAELRGRFSTRAGE
jgi:electron transfer flavoprotein alpha subunit